MGTVRIVIEVIVSLDSWKTGRSTTGIDVRVLPAHEIQYLVNDTGFDGEDVALARL